MLGNFSAWDRSAMGPRNLGDECAYPQAVGGNGPPFQGSGALVCRNPGASLRFAPGWLEARFQRFTLGHLRAQE